ncbi:MAG: DUF305 domain-containing protein [Bryobacteraceae bacterium]|nr:DUF305 domain-containing protein [Bryobacteraceae bacterium]
MPIGFRGGLIGAALLCPLVLAQTIVQPGPPGQPGKVLASAAFTLPPPAKPDIEFMQAMIVHHSQAVEMVDLLRKRGANAALKTLGERITLSQADEIEGMKQWLRERGQSIEMGAMMHHHTPGMDMSKMASGDVAVMPGMLSPNQMKVLAKASGRAFDVLFLTGMIQHHTGAVDMVDDLFASGAGQDNVLFDFATDIDNSQRAEIRIMQSMLAKITRKDKK